MSWEVIELKGMSTGLIVAGVGAIVSIIGATAVAGRLGAGILGFGLAHIVLGLLDLFRPTVRS